MNWTLIILGVIVLILFAWLIYWIRGKIKKNKAIKNQIPQDVLREYEEAERRIEQTNGTVKPEQILWDIYKQRSRGAQESIGTIPGRSPSVTSSSLRPIISRREDLQGKPFAGIKGNSNGTSATQGSSRPTFFTRFTRRSPSS